MFSGDLDRLYQNLILKLYYEGCYMQRDQCEWDAAWELINKIASLASAKGAKEGGKDV